MSSLFTVAEEELGRLALAELSGPLDVVVGGLGLGFTAQAVLANPDVRRLVVVDALGEVIEWHELGLIIAGAELTADPRCAPWSGATSSRWCAPAPSSTPRRGLGKNGSLSSSTSTTRRGTIFIPATPTSTSRRACWRVAERLHPGGAFALWSNDPPDDEFTAALTETFADVRAEIVRFDNPLQQREATATVYLAKTADSRN